MSKQYFGGLTGTGVGQMISKRTENGVAVYFAVEEFEGSLDGKGGAFTLIHKGYMSAENQSLNVEILSGSGHGELKNISGTMKIVQEANQHQYVLNYEL